MVEMTEVKRVTLRLRAGVVGFDVEPELTAAEPLAIPTSAILAMKGIPGSLLALRVRDQGLEPMFFEDDWAVVDTADTAKRSGDIYALNWEGEACIAQLLLTGGQWYMRYFNPTFHRVNLRSGYSSIVGRVIYQPGRIVTGRL